MTSWIVKSQIDDPKRALEIAADQRSQGYKVWIEDENGGDVDEESLKRNDVKRATRTPYEIVMGVLIWGAAAAIAIGGLYACSLLAGD
jgi:hypothetical protein